MTKDEFTSEAGFLNVTINGRPLIVDPKAFSTGSVGWYYQGKVIVTLPDGSTLTCQAQVSLQAVGSKDMKGGDHVTPVKKPALVASSA